MTTELREAIARLRANKPRVTDLDIVCDALEDLLLEDPSSLERIDQNGTDGPIPKMVR